MLPPVGMISFVSLLTMVTGVRVCAVTVLCARKAMLLTVPATVSVPTARTSNDCGMVTVVRVLPELKVAQWRVAPLTFVSVFFAGVG